LRYRRERDKTILPVETGKPGDDEKLWAYRKRCEISFEI
jgi:hypothetical protein